MPWARLDDGAMGHPKILQLSDSAFRLWVKGLCYSQLCRTFGFIPKEALPGLLAKSKDVTDLCRPHLAGRAPLWSVVDGGYEVHNYARWNRSKHEADADRVAARTRMADRRAATRLETANTADVRANTSSEHLRHLHPNTSALVLGGRDGSSEFKEKEEPEISLAAASPPLRAAPAALPRPAVRPPLPPADDPHAGRTGWLLEQYGVWFRQLRPGAKYFYRPHLHFDAAQELVRTWDNRRLEQLAKFVLTTDIDEWLNRSDRGFAVFTAKAQWADVTISQWEREQGRTGSPTASTEPS